MTRIRVNHRFTTALLALAALALPPSAARATSHNVIVYTGLEAALTVADDPRTGGSIVSLLVDRALFGAGGFARGEGAVSGTTPDDGVPPEPILWLVDPFGSTPPDDGSAAISFLINSADEVSGIDPQPFRLFTSIPGGDLFGELDFAAVGGTLGSLNLTGVVVREVDANGNRTGTVYDVDPFTIQAVPLPAAAWLFGTALIGLAGFCKREKAA